jgi:hypothetical protein
MSKTVHGVVHGRTIKVNEDLGIADGQEVQIKVDLIPSPKKWGEGIRASAGGWADYPEMDAIMEEIHQARKLERRAQIENE